MGGLDKSLPALLLPGPEHSREPAEPGCSGTWPCAAFTPLFSRTGFPPSLLPPQQKSPETIPVSRIMGKKSKSCSRRRIKTDSGEGSAEPKRRAGKLSPSLKLGHVTHSSAPSRGHPAAPGEHPLGDGMTPHSASPASGSAAWHCVSGTHRVLNALCGRHRYVPNLRQVSVAPRRHSCPSSDPPHGLRPPSRGTIPCVSAAPLPLASSQGLPLATWHRILESQTFSSPTHVTPGRKDSACPLLTHNFPGKGQNPHPARGALVPSSGHLPRPHCNRHLTVLSHCCHHQALAQAVSSSRNVPSASRKPSRPQYEPAALPLGPHSPEHALSQHVIW